MSTQSDTKLARLVLGHVRQQGRSIEDALEEMRRAMETNSDAARMMRWRISQ